MAIQHLGSSFSLNCELAIVLDIYGNFYLLE